MDYLVEAVALVFDGIVFTLCMKQYCRIKDTLSMIQGAPYLEINSDLESIVSSHPEGKLNYVSLRGIVTPIGSPITSLHNDKINGVVQILKVQEHVLQRGGTGFWEEHKHVIQDIQNSMPFVLESNNAKVEVVDPLAADILDTDVIYENFAPAISSAMDHVWGFFVGVRKQGVQTTEEMLRCDTIITGIGELAQSRDGKTIKLQPPTNGLPFYLTTLHMSSLIKKLNNQKKNYKWICLVCGGIGLVLTGVMALRFYRSYIKKLEEVRLKESLEKHRLERRRKGRDKNLSDIQKCVVCHENPKEIILLPCGHVCLCEDCSSRIDNLCPVCREHISGKSVAFIT